MAHLGNTVINGALRVLGGEYVDTINGVAVGSSPKFTDTTYTAATAAPGNIASSSAQGSSANYARQDHTHGISLATGDSNGQVKIAGTNVSVKGLGTAAYTASTAYATSGHTHTVTIAADSGTSALNMAANTTYKITAGGSTFIFKTPADGNTDTNVTQTATTTSANYEVLFSATADNTTRTEGARKNSNLTFNPSTGNLTVTQLNGVTVGSSPKFTDTNNRKSFYGTCDTAAATAAKVVTLSDTTGWEFRAGTIVGVKFTNSNSASSVTLNINSSGAKSIWYNNAAYTGNSTSICGYASRVIYYMYDGTYWVWLNMGTLDGNTDTKVTQTADDSTNSNFEVIFSATADNTTRTEASRKSSKLLFNPSTGNLQATQLNGVTIGSSPKFTDTTYSSQAAASGGTAVSLVTTGEKYTWNNKSNLAIGTTASTAAAGNHTHTTSIATSSGTNQLTMAASTKYAISAGGTSYIFTTPPNTTYSSKTAASGGTDVSLVTTGEKYTWNNKSNLAIGTTSTTAAAGNHTHTVTIAADSGTNQLTMAANTKYKITAGGSSYIFTTPPDNNNHRTIQMNGTQILGNNTTALNLVAGTNVTLANSGGSVTINASGDGGLSPHLVIYAPANKTVTATKGSQVITATSTSSGVYECDIPAYGDWVLTDGTDSNTLNINIVGYYITTTADGGSVTPTNNITKWLQCAGRLENYTALSEVLADRSCLSALINNNNAMRYLVRCETWATDICGNQNAMGFIGLNNYAATTLLNNATWCLALGKSAYMTSVFNVQNPVMTSDTAPSGQTSASSTYSSNSPWKAFDGNSSTCHTVNYTTVGWLQYKFTEPVLIKYVDVSAGGNKNKIEASNDGSTFTELGNGNGTANRLQLALPNNTITYTYFRVNQTWGSAAYNATYEIKFYGRKDI